MKRLLSVIAALSIVSAVCFSASAETVPAEKADGAMLHTEGNQLISESGEAIRLMGLNVPYMSWSDDCEDEVLNAVDISINEWNGNAVRLAVVPSIWFGSKKESYRALADKVIETVSAAGKYVILDNHSFYLPDDDDISFWEDAANRYKNHPYVVFELFNEPAGCTWQQYYEGGRLTYKGKNDWGEDADVTVDSCGVPELFKTVRATGAKNVCILPGINWSFDLSFCTEDNFEEFAKSVAEEKSPQDIETFVKEYKEKYFMSETDGNGIMYSTHPYPTKPSDWDQYLLDTILEYPVLVGECGPTEKENGFIRKLSDNDKSYLDTLTDYVDRYELNITPWAWGAWPYLNQEPSDKLSAFGTYMKKYFDQSNSEKAVTLYSESDYIGDSLTLEAGKYSADRLLKLGFDISDLKSAACKSDYYQYTVTLYEKGDLSGKEYTFVPNVANINADLCGFEPKSVKIVRTVPENILTDHAKITATGSDKGQPVENIIDGKTGTYWKNVSEKPSEIVISLDDVYALNRIRIAHASEASMMSVFNASDYTVSVSTDGKTFTRIIDVTDNSLGLCEYNFEQVFASYIKIKMTKGSVVENNTYYLAEVMAYGTPYTGERDSMNISIGNYKFGGNTAGKNSVTSLQIVLISVFSVIIIASFTLVTIVAVKIKKKK